MTLIEGSLTDEQETELVRSLLGFYDEGFTRRMLRRIQEEQQMATNAPPRRRGNMPPFEQLQQSREARQQNVRSVNPEVSATNLNNSIGQHINIPINNIWSYSDSFDYNRFTDYGLSLSSNVNELTVQRVREEQIRQLELYMAEEARRQKRREEKQKLIALYDSWARRNVYAKQTDINTSMGYFRKQKKSIEVELLECISSGKPLNTKTTRFDPDRYTVSLFGHQIAQLDSETYKVISVTFPKEIANTKLFRHRLRQLGIHCLLKRGETRLYYAHEKYIAIKPGQTQIIPDWSNLIVLPKEMYKKSIIEIPRQLSLGFDDGWKLLSVPETYIDTHNFLVHTREDARGIMIRGSAYVNMEEYSVRDHVISYTMIASYKELSSIRIKSIISTLVEKVRKQVRSFIDSKYIEKLTLDMSSNTNKFYSWQTDVWNQSTTTASTWTVSTTTNPDSTVYERGTAGGGGGGTYTIRNWWDR